MLRARAFLRTVGLPDRDDTELPTSPHRFPDGATHRIEIPSVEGPRLLRGVLEESGTRGVPIHRVSQGSGISLLTDAEISEMVALGAEARVEVNLFVGPRATYDVGAQVFAPAGRSLGLSIRGADQFLHAIMDVRRATDLGIRSVLVSDLGLLQVLSRMRSEGELPPDLILKTSVMMAPANPASARLLQDLGADTINIPSDLSLPQIASLRSVLTVPIDFYVEAPDNVGGFIRYHELAEIVRVASPVYVKLGLRNAPDIYPCGGHLETTALAMAKERVRRAEIALAMLSRYASDGQSTAAVSQ